VSLRRSKQYESRNGGTKDLAVLFSAGAHRFPDGGIIDDPENLLLHPFFEAGIFDPADRLFQNAGARRPLPFLQLIDEGICFLSGKRAPGICFQCLFGLPGKEDVLPYCRLDLGERFEDDPLPVPDDEESLTRRKVGSHRGRDNDLALGTHLCYGDFHTDR
jgi:hypothetical protein